MVNRRFGEVESYAEAVLFGLEQGRNDELRERRESIDAAGLSSSGKQDLYYLDTVVIESVMTDSGLDKSLFDDGQYGTESWWWHLGKIRNKTFPADQFPVYLRAIYQETK
jgi:hypothetical protein